MTELLRSHAIVTGASRGLGRVVADALAAAGANVTLAARSGRRARRHPGTRRAAWRAGARRAHRCGRRRRPRSPRRVRPRRAGPPRRGGHTSRWIGTTTPHKVADAVVRALRANAPELIVSPGPFRVMMAAGQLFPAINAPVTNWLVGGMLRAVADHRRHARHRPASAAPA